jgi:hypothetical protein
MLNRAVVVVSAARLHTHAGCEYSMPPATIDQGATLHLDEDRVEILTKTGELVRHPRTAEPTSLCSSSTRAMFDSAHGAGSAALPAPKAVRSAPTLKGGWRGGVTKSWSASHGSRTTAQRPCVTPST